MRKLKEAVLTVKLEATYSSQTYFGKSALELQLAEAALLAGLRHLTNK